MCSQIRRWCKSHPWQPLFIAMGLLLLWIGIDERLKSASFDGYCPENATWIAAAQNLPLVYGGVVTSDAGIQVGEELRKPFAALARDVRLATGIRVTPLRWWVWFGRHAVAAYAPEGVGICVRPGLLMRAVDLYRRTIQRARSENGISTFGPVCYAWREGFLICSRSRAYVEACRTAQAPVLEPSSGRDALRVHWRAAPQGAVHCLARDGLPVSGWIQGGLHHRTAPLTLADAWPAPPMIAVAASKWADLEVLFALAWTGVRSAWPGLERESSSYGPPLKPLYDFVATQWNLRALSNDWDSVADECAAAIMDVDTSEVTPVPEAALVLRCANPITGPHPLELLAPAATSASYEWNGHPGQVAPWMGEKLAVCLSRCDRDWLLATQEPLMARLAGALRTAPMDADAAVRIDWKKLGGSAENVLRKAADLELVPRMNAKDVEDRVMPFVRAAARLGTLQLEVQSENDRLTFHGFLARQDARVQTAQATQDHRR